MKRKAQPVQPTQSVPQGRDIILRIKGPQCSVNVRIDACASGGVLAQRAASCFGSCNSLALPNGQVLDMDRPLEAQGILDGCELTCSSSKGMKASKWRLHATGRQEVPLRKFHWKMISASSHKFLEDMGFQEDHLFLEIVSKHIPEAAADLIKENVTVECAVDNIKVKIRGHSADYVLSREIGSVGRTKTKSTRLVMGWPLCPCRCFCIVKPHKKLTIVLRSTPPSAIPLGTRVGIQDFNFRGEGYGMELNGRTGIITGFKDAKPTSATEHNFPFLYCVELEVLKLVISIHARHLVPLEEGDEPLLSSTLLPVLDPGEEVPQVRLPSVEGHCADDSCSDSGTVSE